jgi:hypothetical protein
VKSTILQSAARVIVLVFCASLLIPFQNCSVYKSDGRKEFDSSLVAAEDKGCYPYIDTNIAKQLLGVLSGELNIYKYRADDEDAYTCEFRSAVLMKHTNCKISEGSGELTLLLKQYGESAFEDTIGIWTAGASGVRPGFVGANHGGYVTDDSDGLYTVKYLALDGTENKCVSCAIRFVQADYAASAATIKDSLSKLTIEMAIQNKE